jgi:farnesyl diphosphate synthase
LVHDDLPALDNDEWRRGRPTVHRVHGEATAILAGDALLALGFEILAREPAGVDGSSRAEAVRIVAEAVSSRGLLGGQQEDLETERAWPLGAEEAVLRIAQAKTGALFGACLELAALYAGCEASTRDAYRRFGVLLGEVFQLRDDLLDVFGSQPKLGKTPGKDARQGKLTPVALWGVEGAKHHLFRKLEEGFRQLEALSRPPALLGDALAYAAERAM